MSKHKREDGVTREDVEEMLRDARDAVEDQFDDAYKLLKRQCRENPLGVTGAALGVGLVIGLLLGSRR
jgi:ElaB/YqjD/DUF883 family membrane-anchored ribosome-binding protein